MENPTYSVITFAPVQGFIEKSRKLRDLYGSSYLLSFLSWAICQTAIKQGCQIVSPALPNITQGMPNQIIIEGQLSENGPIEIRSQFYRAWKIIVDTCRQWIEKKLDTTEFIWKREWELWDKYAWEFFLAPGKTDNRIAEVRELINQYKSSRDWTGINWQGESSTLSGADAIAHPRMAAFGKPSEYNHQEKQKAIREFCTQLSYKLGESFIEETPGLKPIKNHPEKCQEYGSHFLNIREQLSIPELIKRLITHKAIAKKVVENLKSDRLFKDLLKTEELKEFAEISEELNPQSFTELNRHDEEYWTGWFQGDGDGAGKYFKSLKTKTPQEEEEKTHEFSAEMREWGSRLKSDEDKHLEENGQKKGRTIYAGGDDFLGVLYKQEKQIPPKECLEWFYNFKSQIWHGDKPKKINCSVGFVWAGSQVPQRDVLQHCRDAEKSAKNSGRDRIAFRILFNSGNYLEWVCPWWVLDREEIAKLSSKFPPPKQNLIESYRSRSQDNNWTHFYRDVAWLESRHGFEKEMVKEGENVVKNPQIEVALGLIEIYFGPQWHGIIADSKNWFNCYDENEIQTFTGILGDVKKFDNNFDGELTNEALKTFRENYQVKQAFNDWVINLAKVGFRLTEE